MDYYDNVPITDATSECIVFAANRYQVNPAVILSILRVEGGKTGRVSYNSNGTYDIGLMQINSIHLKELAKTGISFQQLKNNGCLNVAIGAYYIKKAELSGSKSRNGWNNIANYHSRTEVYNNRYAYKIAKAAYSLPQEWVNYDCNNYNSCEYGVEYGR